MRTTVWGGTVLMLAGCLTGERVASDAYERAADEISALQRRIDGLESELRVRQQQYEDDLASLEARVETAEQSLGQLGSTWITVNATWTVDGTGGTPTTFESLGAAMNEARKFRISPDARLSIELDEGTYVSSSPVSLNHLDGSSISIAGDTSGPRAVVLVFQGSDGITMDAGHAFGGLSGVTVHGDESGAWVGVDVRTATLVGVESVIVEHWGGAGIHLSSGAVLVGEDVVVQDNGGEGVRAEAGALLDVEGLRAERNGSYGMFLDTGSVAHVPASQYRLNHSGALVYGGSAAFFGVSEFVGNSRHGLSVQVGGAVSGVGSIASANGQYGVLAGLGASGNIGGTAEGNGSGSSNIWNTDAFIAP